MTQENSQNAGSQKPHLDTFATPYYKYNLLDTHQHQILLFITIKLTVLIMQYIYLKF